MDDVRKALGLGTNASSEDVLAAIKKLVDNKNNSSGSGYNSGYNAGYNAGLEAGKDNTNTDNTGSDNGNGTTDDNEADDSNTTDTKPAATKTKLTSKNTTVKLSVTSYTYNGKTKTPSVVIKDSNGKKISSKYYTVTYKNNKKVGTATLTIKFKDKYTGTITKTFKVNPKSTTIKKATSSKAKTITVTWKKQATQTTGYQIQYATDKKFSKNKKTLTVKSTKTTSKTIKNLSAKKKYYIRIRTYKIVGGKKYYSSWSKVQTVKTK
jgi:hypothetical protein